MALNVVALADKMCGKTKAEIARSLKMSQTTFCQKALGQRRFTVEEALDLQEVLNLSLDDMHKIWKGDN